MGFVKKLKNISKESRPKMRWWVPSTLTDENEATREIKMMKEAGFGGAEVAPKYILNPATSKNEFGWGAPEWGETVRKIIKAAKELDFEIDLMVMPSSSMLLDIIKDPNDITQGARWELDGAFIDGITKDNPYYGALPLNNWALRNSNFVNGHCVLYAVTVAKYIDKEKRILSFDSARELDLNECVEKTWDDPISYKIKFTPKDEGEYVLFAWWEHPSGMNRDGIPQLDFIGEYGTKRFIEYHEKEFLPSLGEYKDYVTSYFVDSIEWCNHLNVPQNFRETFIKKQGFDITKYLPAIYEKGYGGCYRMPCPEFKFEKNSAQLMNSYGEFITSLYIENHINPLREFCNKNGMTLRYQTSYGCFFELQKTAGFVDIPDTETLYGKDIIDFYRAQSGAMHVTGKDIYSVEASAEKPGRGNGKENSGNYAQTFKNHLWHLQRAYAGGVNQVYFHGCRYRGHYYGVGNQNGVLPNVHWPGYEPMGVIGGWSNSWDDRQPNWYGMRQLTDTLSRIQQVLQEGKQLVDLAIYRHSYQETLDVCGAEKAFKSTCLEQLGYSYDFLSPAHFTDSVKFNGKGLFSDGPCYKALIFNNQKHLPENFAKILVELAKQGLAIIFVGEVPSEPTFFGENSIIEQMANLKTYKNVGFCDGLEDLPSLLKEMSITPYVSYDKPQKVLNVYRKTESKDYVYFYNYADADTYPELAGAEKVTFKVWINGRGTPYLLDPWTAGVKTLKVLSQDSDKILVELELAPNDSVIIVVDKEPNSMFSALAEKSRVLDVRNSFEIKNWSLEVESWTAGATALETKKEIVKKTAIETPICFTKIKGLDAVSGVGYYSSEFDWKTEGYGAYISAEKIEDCYKIEVNGVTVPANQVEPLVDIGPYLKLGKNTIKITVYSTLLNATIDYCNKNNIANNGHFEDYGLEGPVKIIPYKIEK